MTEATGGITMTPPGRLPGRVAGRAASGHRGAAGRRRRAAGPRPLRDDRLPRPARGRSRRFDADGWFATGDLMEQDTDGHLRLVDRKKEIYKNVKGETIAPQRVENLFRDFESVGRVFLVGDHREYNILLIYPNPDYAARGLQDAFARGDAGPLPFAGRLGQQVPRPVRAHRRLRHHRSGPRSGAGRADAQGHSPPADRGAQLRRADPRALPAHGTARRRRGADAAQLAVPGDRADRPGHRDRRGPDRPASPRARRSPCGGSRTTWPRSAPASTGTPAGPLNLGALLDLAAALAGQRGTGRFRAAGSGGPAATRTHRGAA